MCRVTSYIFEFASIAVSSGFSVLSKDMWSATVEFRAFSLFRGVAFLFILLLCGLCMIRFVCFVWKSVFRPSRSHYHYRLHLYVYVLLLYVIFNVPSALSNGKASKEIQSLVYSKLTSSTYAKTPSTPTPTPMRSKAIGAARVNTISLASTIRDALFSAPSAKNVAVATKSDSRYVCREKVKNGTSLYFEEVFRLVNWKKLTTHDEKLNDYFTSCIPAAFITILIGMR